MSNTATVMARHAVLTNHDCVTKWEDGVSEGKVEYVSRPIPGNHPNKLVSEHVGMEGTRTNFFLKFVAKRETRNNYTVYEFVDEVGNHFIIFSNSIQNENGVDIVEGYCYLIKATIKRHQENTFKNSSVKQTVLNRIFIWKTIGVKES